MNYSNWDARRGHRGRGRGGNWRGRGYTRMPVASPYNVTWPNSQQPYNLNNSYYRGSQKFYSHKSRPFSQYRKLSPPPKPPSPLPGTEEYTQRNIQQASELIKRQLNIDSETCSSSDINPTALLTLNPSASDDSKTTGESANASETDSTNRTSDVKKSGPHSSKQKGRPSEEIDVQDIHDKIIRHISNLSYSKKINLVNQSSSSGYDIAIEEIQKQKRLELSRALRDMSKRQTQCSDDGEVINSILPDIGIKIEDLPKAIIAELSSTLHVDVNEHVNNLAGPGFGNSLEDPEAFFQQAQAILDVDFENDFNSNSQLALNESQGDFGNLEDSQLINDTFDFDYLNRTDEFDCLGNINADVNLEDLEKTATELELTVASCERIGNLDTSVENYGPGPLPAPPYPDILEHYSNSPSLQSLPEPPCPNVLEPYSNSRSLPEPPCTNFMQELSHSPLRQLSEPSCPNIQHQYPNSPDSKRPILGDGQREQSEGANKETNVVPIVLSKDCNPPDKLNKDNDFCLENFDVNRSYLTSFSQPQPSSEEPSDEAKTYPMLKVRKDILIDPNSQFSLDETNVCKNARVPSAPATDDSLSLKPDVVKPDSAALQHIKTEPHANSEPISTGSVVTDIKVEAPDVDSQKKLVGNSLKLSTKHNSKTATANNELAHKNVKNKGAKPKSTTSGSEASMEQKFMKSLSERLQLLQEMEKKKTGELKSPTSGKHQPKQPEATNKKETPLPKEKPRKNKKSKQKRVHANDNIKKAKDKRVLPKESKDLLFLRFFDSFKNAETETHSSADSAKTDSSGTAPTSEKIKEEPRALAVKVEEHIGGKEAKKHQQAPANKHKSTLDVRYRPQDPIKSGSPIKAFVQRSLSKANQQIKDDKMKEAELLKASPVFNEVPKLDQTVDKTRTAPLHKGVLEGNKSGNPIAFEERNEVKQAGVTKPADKMEQTPLCETIPLKISKSRNVVILKEQVRLNQVDVSKPGVKIEEAPLCETIPLEISKNRNLVSVKESVQLNQVDVAKPSSRIEKTRLCETIPLEISKIGSFITFEEHSELNQVDAAKQCNKMEKTACETIPLEINNSAVTHKEKITFDQVEIITEDVARTGAIDSTKLLAVNESHVSLQSPPNSKDLSIKDNFSASDLKETAVNVSAKNSSCLNPNILNEPQPQITADININAFDISSKLTLPTKVSTTKVLPNLDISNLLDDCGKNAKNSPSAKSPVTGQTDMKTKSSSEASLLESIDTVKAELLTSDIIDASSQPKDRKDITSFLKDIIVGGESADSVLADKSNVTVGEEKVDIPKSSLVLSASKLEDVCAIDVNGANGSEESESLAIVEKFDTELLDSKPEWTILKEDTEQEAPHALDHTNVEKQNFCGPKVDIDKETCAANKTDHNMLKIEDAVVSSCLKDENPAIESSLPIKEPALERTDEKQKVFVNVSGKCVDIKGAITAVPDLPCSASQENSLMAVDGITDGTSQDSTKKVDLSAMNPANKTETNLQLLQTDIVQKRWKSPGEKKMMTDITPNIAGCLSSQDDAPHKSVPITVMTASISANACSESEVKKEDQAMVKKTILEQMEEFNRTMSISTKNELVVKEESETKPEPDEAVPSTSTGTGINLVEVIEVKDQPKEKVRYYKRKRSRPAAVEKPPKENKKPEKDEKQNKSKASSSKSKDRGSSTSKPSTSGPGNASDKTSRRKCDEDKVKGDKKTDELAAHVKLEGKSGTRHRSKSREKSSRSKRSHSKERPRGRSHSKESLRSTRSESKESPSSRRSQSKDSPRSRRSHSREKMHETKSRAKDMKRDMSNSVNQNSKEKHFTVIKTEPANVNETHHRKIKTAAEKKEAVNLIVIPTATVGSQTDFEIGEKRKVMQWSFETQTESIKTHSIPIQVSQPSKSVGVQAEPVQKSEVVNKKSFKTKQSRYKSALARLREIDGEIEKLTKLKQSIFNDLADSEEEAELPEENLSQTKPKEATEFNDNVPEKEHVIEIEKPEICTDVVEPETNEDEKENLNQDDSETGKCFIEEELDITKQPEVALETDAEQTTELQNEEQPTPNISPSKRRKHATTSDVGTNLGHPLMKNTRKRKRNKSKERSTEPQQEQVPSENTFETKPDISERVQSPENANAVKEEPERKKGSLSIKISLKNINQSPSVSEIEQDIKEEEKARRGKKRARRAVKNVVDVPPVETVADVPAEACVEGGLKMEEERVQERLPIPKIKLPVKRFRSSKKVIPDAENIDAIDLVVDKFSEELREIYPEKNSTNGSDSEAGTLLDRRKRSRKDMNGGKKGSAGSESPQLDTSAESLPKDELDRLFKRTCCIPLTRYNLNDLEKMREKISYDSKKEVELIKNEEEGNANDIAETPNEENDKATGSIIPSITLEIDDRPHSSQSVSVSLSGESHNHVDEDINVDVYSHSSEHAVEQKADHEVIFNDFDGAILVIKVIDSTILAGGENGNLYYFDLTTGQLMETLSLSKKPITSLCTLNAEDDVHVFAGSLSNKMRVVGFNSRKIIDSIRTDEGIQCMELSWGYLFMGSHKGQLIRYDIKKEKVENTVKIYDTNVLVIKATQEGARRVLLVATRNSHVTVRDAMTGLLMRTMESDFYPTVYTILLERSMVYCGTSHHDILVYTFQDGQLVFKHEATNSKGVVCMEIVGKLLFAGCYNGNVYVYNVESNSYLGQMNGPGGMLLSMAIVNNKIIVGTKSSKLRSWNIPQRFLDNL